MSSRTCLLLSVLVAAGAALKPRLDYSLGLHAQRFARALVNGQSREIYRAFVPVFRDEIEFARFDSAVRAWRAGRRITSVRNRVVDVRGLGGHASTYVMFGGETDYEYVYQSWLNTGEGWRLAWLSNILDQTFQYGRSDTASLEAAARAALAWILTDSGIRRVHRRFVLPDTVIVVTRGRHEEGDIAHAGRPLVWRTPAELAGDGGRTGAAFYCELGLVRVFGDIGVAAVDFVPLREGRPPLDRRRGIELYLRRDRQGWRFQSVGKVW